MFESIIKAFLKGCLSYLVVVGPFGAPILVILFAAHVKVLSLCIVLNGLGLIYYWVFGKKISLQSFF